MGLRIIYGVNSEGMGHATRSRVVIEYLLKKGHEVYIFSSDRAYDYLSKHFKHVESIKGFHLIYHGDTLRNMHSTVHVLKNLHKDLIPSIRKLIKSFYEIKPHLVISDFESFTTMIAVQAGVPVIQANNISMVNKTHVDKLHITTIYSKVFAYTADLLQTMNANYFVIPTFFFPKPRSKKVILTHPAVRESIIKEKPTNGDHILVYYTTPTNKELLRRLSKIDEKFMIYGFGKKKSTKNLKFHAFSNKGFINHLKSCKAVIMGGSFSLMSEALYLKKPVMSIPLKRHFEQIMNGYYIQKMKFGEFCKDQPTVDDITDFLLKIPFYKHYLNNYNFDPSEFPKKIESLARKIGKEPNKLRLAALKGLTLS